MKPRLDPRIFLALPISRTVQARLAHIQGGLKEYLENWHFVDERNFHVTLRFFGEVPEDSIPEIHNACLKIAPNIIPFSLHWNKLDFFGPPQAGRVLFASAVDSPELGSLAKAMVSKFPEVDSRKKFRPHITLCKARKNIERTAQMRNQNMLRRLREHGRIGPEPLDVDIRTFHREFVLMETVWVGRAVEYEIRQRYHFAGE